MTTVCKAGSIWMALLFVSALLGAPAGALDVAFPSPTSSRPSDAPRLPVQWTADPTSALADLATARGTVLSHDEFRTLRTEVLAAEAAAVAPSFVFPYRAGDLDGDAKKDVLTFEYVGEFESVTLNARGGADGGVLWSAPDVGFAVPTDVDADGVSEVLTVADEWTPVASGVRLLTERVSLLRGADGTPIWTLVLQGSDGRNWDELGGRGHDLQFVSSMRPMPDATGDGKADIWVGTTNGFFVDRSEQNGVYVTGDVFIGRTIDGATGVEIGRVAAPGLDALPWAIPTADVSGDGLADVIAVSGRSWDTGLLSAHSAFGTPWWVRPIPTGQAYLSSADLDGDGAPDVTLQAFHEGGPSRIAHNGATGDELWSQPDNGYIDFAGDIDGDGGTDLIQLVTYDSGLIATAWSGADGEPIWGPVDYPAAPGAWVAFCICTDDVSGDGVWDPLTAEVVFGSESVDVTVRMLNGADGTQLWTQLMAPGDGFPVPIGADADGDGIGDMAYGTSAGVDVRRGFDLAPLWSLAGEPGYFLLGFYGDDLAGDARAEIVAARLTFVDEAIQGSAAAYDRDGLLWSAP